MYLKAEDIKKGDRVGVRYVQTSNQTWFRGTVEKTGVWACSDNFDASELVIKLDEGQERSYVHGQIKFYYGKFYEPGSNIEVRPLVEQEEAPVVQIKKALRDSKGRFVKKEKVLVEA